MSKEHPEIRKTVSDVYDFVVDFARVLEVVWGAGDEYAVDDVVRPTASNGYEYKCTSAGQSSHREPKWLKSVGATVIDGSVTWTAQKPTSSGRDSLQSINIEAPSGLTVVDSAVIGTKVPLRVSGGVYNEDVDPDDVEPYEISVEATTAGGELIEKKVYVEITGA